MRASGPRPRTLDDADERPRPPHARSLLRDVPNYEYGDVVLFCVLHDAAHASAKLGNGTGGRRQVAARHRLHRVDDQDPCFDLFRLLEHVLEGGLREQFESRVRKTEAA